MNAEKRTKADILGCYIDLLNMREVINRVERIIKKGKPAHLITLNAEIAYQAQNDETLRKVINSAEMVTADGIGIVWAARQKGYGMQERVTGIDLFYELCSLAAKKGWKLYFLGAAPGVAERAAENLMKEYPSLSVCGCRNGYFDDRELKGIIADIKEKSPEILFLALGVPKQEYWISEYKDELNIPLCLGIGGSFDVVAGIKKRAPALMIKLNLEWLYRLISEPLRIKRQIALPKFVLLILKEKYFPKAKP
jgi:N-acetylglucosaminyldiphosphoundecaprenol N-acetyl-beta-D-mannosaminyltransferase